MYSGGHYMQAPLLPPAHGHRKTLVLDLDRTLVDCIRLGEASSSEPDFVYTDDQGASAKVWTRPFLKQFLNAVAKDFEVVLFTAAGPRHADSVLQVLDPDNRIFLYRLYGHHTRECPAWGWVKDLSRLGRPLHKTLLVDDSLLAGLAQPCNLIPIRPFIQSDPKKDWDTALPELLRFLQDKVLPAADVRQVIGAFWNKITRRPRKAAICSRAVGSCSCACHMQLHSMISHPGLTAALISPTKTRPAKVHRTHLLCGAGAATPVAQKLLELHHNSLSPAAAGPQPAGDEHHRCPAADAGCGCMCAGAEEHVLAAVTIAYRLSLELCSSGQGGEDDLDEEACQCCQHGLPRLCPGLGHVPLRSLTQAADRAPAVHAAAMEATNEAPSTPKAMHKSKTEWALSAQDDCMPLPVAEAQSATDPCAAAAHPDAAAQTCSAVGSPLAPQMGSKLLVGVIPAGQQASASSTQPAGPAAAQPVMVQVTAAGRSPFSHPVEWSCDPEEPEHNAAGGEDGGASLVPMGGALTPPGYWYHPPGYSYQGSLCYNAASMRWERVESLASTSGISSSSTSSSSSSDSSTLSSSCLHGESTDELPTVEVGVMPCQLESTFQATTVAIEVS